MVPARNPGRLPERLVALVGEGTVIEVPLEFIEVARAWAMNVVPA